MRQGKRERQEALLLNPEALALWVERKRARDLQAIVKSNQGLKHERVNMRVDRSFDRDYVMGKAYHAPREMRAAMGSFTKSPTPKRWSQK